MSSSLTVNTACPVGSYEGSIVYVSGMHNICTCAIVSGHLSESGRSCMRSLVTIVWLCDGHQWCHRRGTIGEMT